VSICKVIRDKEDVKISQQVKTELQHLCRVIQDASLSLKILHEA